jgi:N-acyl homoserine lactone hydrolase
MAWLVMRLPALCASATMLEQLAQERDAEYILGHEPAQVQQYPRFPHVYR